MSSSSSFGAGTSFGTTALGTSPFYDVKSLIDSILKVTGHGSNPAGETLKRAALAVILNNKYQEICLGRNWRWLKASYDTRFVAPYKTGTAYAANNDATITGVGTSFSAAILPKDTFWFNAASVVYHVASISSPTSLELETKFSEDTILVANAEAFTIARPQYKLPKETDQVLVITLGGGKKLVPVGPEDLRGLQATGPARTGTPEVFSYIRRDTDDDAMYIEVYPAPDKDYQVHIDYTVRILYLEDSVDCYPIIPDRYRAVLYYAALAEFYYTVLRDPTNADRAFRDYQTFYQRMANDHQTTDQDLTMIPARDYLRRRKGARGRVSYTMEDFAKEG